MATLNTTSVRDTYQRDLQRAIEDVPGVDEPVQHYNKLYQVYPFT